MNRPNKNSLPKGSFERLPVDSNLSRQKLVRDDVVFKQCHDRDQALRDAIDRMDFDKRRELVMREDEAFA